MQGWTNYQGEQFKDQQAKRLENYASDVMALLAPHLHSANGQVSLVGVKIRRSTQEPHTQWQARASLEASQNWSGPTRSI
jgi:plasmid stabilization system protein ParE